MGLPAGARRRTRPGGVRWACHETLAHSCTQPTNRASIPGWACHETLAHSCTQPTNRAYRVGAEDSQRIARTMAREATHHLSPHGANECQRVLQPLGGGKAAVRQLPALDRKRRQGAGGGQSCAAAAACGEQQRLGAGPASLSALPSPGATAGPTCGSSHRCPGSQSAAAQAGQGSATRAGRGEQPGAGNSNSTLFHAAGIHPWQPGQQRNPGPAPGVWPPGRALLRFCSSTSPCTRARGPSRRLAR